MTDVVAATHTPFVRRLRSQSATVTLTTIVVGLVLAAQVPLALRLLHPDVIFEAGHAKGVLLVNIALTALTVAAAALLPARRRALALLPGAALAATMLGASITVGGHVGDAAMALLTVAGAWWLGRATLRLLGVPALQGVAIIELTIGLGWAGLAILLLGRVHALRWWSVGVLAIALGAAGAWTAAREGWSRRGAAWTAATGTPVSVACAGLLLVQFGWALVWLSAPEIMYDAIYGKAYLPALWAATGSIGPLLIHPVLNVAGLASVVAVSGHAVGAPDVGRWLQMAGWIVLVTTTWWWPGRKSVAGPLAALFVGVVPQLVWQSATAFDDIALALGAVALTLAVLRTADGRTEPSLGLALAIGLLTGACVWLKLNLIGIAAVLAAGWVLLAGAPRGLPRRAGAVLLGALVVAGPQFALRWIDTGDPVFPSYNTIFKSPHYPFVDEQYNFPWWPHAGPLGAVKAPYEAIVHPFLMNEAAPPGDFGLLVAAVVLGLFLGWRQPTRRAGLIAWGAVVVSLVLWWAQFRYLRYTVPIAMACVMLVLAQLRDWRPRRAGTVAALAAAGLAAILYLPTTVASFWNVPHRTLPFAAAFGHWSAEDYLRTVFPEKDALEAYAKLAPRGADAVSDAHERLFVVGRDLSPPWEAGRLMELYGPDPTSPDDTYRRLRRLGIDWAIVAAPGLTGAGLPWIAPLLAAHGTAVFADRGWGVYRLTGGPARPRPFDDCDPSLRGGGACWTGTLDARPGLRDGESAGGVNRNLPVCPGELVAVEATTAPDGQAATVSLNANSGDPKAGHTSGSVAPGSDNWVYGTVPPGASAMNVLVVPGAAGAVLHVHTALLGHCGSSIR